MMRWTRVVIVALVGIWFLNGCGKSDSTGATGDSKAATESAAKKRKFAVIPKGLTHEFWRSVHFGAQQAADELGDVEIIWKGAPKEDDTTEQINLVQTFVSRGVDGIVLAPVADDALAAPVMQATKAGIPVVVIDSAVSGEAGKDFVSYVGTDNYTAGTLAGKRMREILNGSGTVLILRYAPSSAATVRREQGFIDAATEAPTITLIDPPAYAGADVSSARQAAQNLLTTHEGKFTAIFCPNESSTEGMLIALEERKLSGKFKFVGFDTNERLIEALRKGHLHGTVLQNPVRMGYLGVMTMSNHLFGKDCEQTIDTGAAIITPENMDEPEMKKLLNPPKAD